MSRFTEAVDIAIDHWNQADGESNSVTLDSLEIDHDEFGEITSRVLLQLLLRGNGDDLAVYGIEAFLFGLLVGQKFEAIKWKAPDRA